MYVAVVRRVNPEVPHEVLVFEKCSGALSWVSHMTDPEDLVWSPVAPLLLVTGVVIPNFGPEVDLTELSERLMASGSITPSWSPDGHFWSTEFSRDGNMGPHVVRCMFWLSEAASLATGM